MVEGIDYAGPVNLNEQALQYLAVGWVTERLLPLTSNHADEGAEGQPPNPYQALKRLEELLRHSQRVTRWNLVKSKLPCRIWRVSTSFPKASAAAEEMLCQGCKASRFISQICRVSAENRLP